MNLATSKLYLQLHIFVFLAAATVAHLHTFLGECLQNDVMVNCRPACPRMCLDNLLIRKCRVIKCTPGCACKEGWVRKGSITGICIERSQCKRWIL